MRRFEYFTLLDWENYIYTPFSSPTNRLMFDYNNTKPEIKN